MATLIQGNKGLVATPVILEEMTGAMAIMDNDHRYIHQGLKFSAFSKDVVTAGSSIEFGFKTPAAGYVHYRPAGIYPSADKVDTEIYEGAVFTAATGTALVISNRNRVSPIVAGVELRKSPTFTTAGALLPAFSSWLAGSTGVGQERAPSAAEGGDEIVLKQNTTYRFKAINGSSASNTIGFRFSWYEED
jgi:hypothetical protein